MTTLDEIRARFEREGTEDGSEYEIYGVHKDRLFGRIADGSARWSLEGKSPSNTCFNLIPRSPRRELVSELLRIRAVGAQCIGTDLLNRIIAELEKEPA